MKIVRTADQFQFRLSKEEHGLLWDLLELYPCVSNSNRRGQGGKIAESSKNLLEEALAEQRADNKKRVQAFLAKKSQQDHTDKGLRFSLSQTEFEWLLQILNDVRVGSWILLGSPEEKLTLQLLNEKTAPHFWAMELAGHFEMQMLSVLNE